MLAALAALAAGIVTVAACQPVDSTAVYFFPNENPVTDISIWKQNFGDSMSWSGPAFDDSRWIMTGAGTLWVHAGNSGKGIRWFRQTIFIPEPLDSLRVIALYQRSIICASELYWDGRLLAQNGRIRDSIQDEVPGKSSQFTVVPPHLSVPGRHIIALRVSNFHTYSGLMEEPLLIGYLPDLLGRQHLIEMMMMLCAGIFLVAGLFHFAILLGRTTGPAYALFGVLCLSSALYLLIDTAVHYFPFSLARYYTIALVNDLPWFFMIVLLPVFFLFEFSVPRRMFWSALIAAIALICIVPPRLIMFDLLPESWLAPFLALNQALMYAVTIIAAAIAFFKMVRRKSGSLLALIGCMALFAGTVISYETPYVYAWSLGFCLLIILLTISLSRQMAQQNRLRQENELRGTRLELELLKKHIQPHFLLNSLNSIIAWLEENPATAGRLVHALADELRALLDFSKEKLVPVNEELRLCRLHCEVMGLRQDKRFSIVADEIPENEKLPPLVLHTLVENGLTHGLAGGKASGEFFVRRAEVPGAIRYTVFNASGGDHASDPAAVIVREGTGIRYVKTRLQEAFPDAWSLSYGPRDNGWEVVIKVPSAGKK
jgi:hypothetical protein